MELVPGEALSAIIERERVLTTDRVLDIVAQTAMALQAAHAAGLVHRDIKPGNLLITPDGRVKITDFGIARIADQVPLTATGQVMGTVQYLSPEQASGHPASPSTDVYSLGIVAYEMLAGRRPFTGESQVAIAMAQINETPPELPSVVAEPVRNLVYSSIAKKPADRPASAAHFARAAQSLRRGDVNAAAAAVPAIIGAGSLAATAGANYGRTEDATRVLATTETTPTEAPRKRNPWTWPLIALIAVLAVVLIGTIIALLANPDDEEPQPSGTPSASSTPSPTPSPTAAAITINLADVEGKTKAQVQQILEAKELVLEPLDGATAPSTDLVGTAYAINPEGRVSKGDVIAVRFYSPIPAPPKPTTVSPGSSEQQAGSDLDVNWAAYSGCPTGFPLSGYSFSVTGASPSATEIPAGTTTLTLTFPDVEATSTISYVARCGDLTSPASDVVTYTVILP